MNKDQNLIFEAYTQTKILAENELDPESGRLDDDLVPAKTETIGEFDNFIDAATNFADSIDDKELEFLVKGLTKDNLGSFLGVIRDEYGYRDQTPIEDYES